MDSPFLTPPEGKGPPFLTPLQPCRKSGGEASRSLLAETRLAASDFLAFPAAFTLSLSSYPVAYVVADFSPLGPLS